MRLLPEELYVLRLADKLPDGMPNLGWLKNMSREQCLAELRDLTGIDLGADPQAWEEWMLLRKARRENSDAGLLIARLRGETPPGPRYEWLRQMTPAECLEDLRKHAGRDLGNDPEAWSAWWRQANSERQLDGALLNYALFPEELLLWRLSGTLAPGSDLDWLLDLTSEECFEELKRRSGRDFGAEFDAWHEWWLAERPQRYLEDAIHLLPPYDWTAEGLLICRLKDAVPESDEYYWLRAMSREACIDELRRRTGLDLGDDPGPWCDWFDRTG